MIVSSRRNPAASPAPATRSGTARSTGAATTPKRTMGPVTLPGDASTLGASSPRPAAVGPTCWDPRPTLLTSVSTINGIPISIRTNARWSRSPLGVRCQTLCARALARRDDGRASGVSLRIGIAREKGRIKIAEELPVRCAEIRVRHIRRYLVSGRIKVAVAITLIPSVRI